MITGVVQKVYKKQKGKFTVFSVLLGDEWYGHGFVKPKFDEGNKISFEFEENQYGKQIQPDSVKVLTNAVAQAPAVKAMVNAAANAKDDYWTKKAEDDKERQKVISFQAAHNTAIEMVNFGVAQGLVVLGSAKASAPDKWAAYKECVFELSDDLFARFNLAGSVESSDAPTTIKTTNNEGNALDD